VVKSLTRGASVVIFLNTNRANRQGMAGRYTDFHEFLAGDDYSWDVDPNQDGEVLFQDASTARQTNCGSLLAGACFDHDGNPTRGGAQQQQREPRPTTRTIEKEDSGDVRDVCLRDVCR
jgi:hypothetical protein